MLPPDAYAALRRHLQALKRKKKLDYWEENEAYSGERGRILLKREARPPNPLVNDEAWIQHFSELFDKKCSLPPKVPAEPDPLAAPITAEEVLGVIKRKKNGKAPGPDDLVYEHFKADVTLTVPPASETPERLSPKRHSPGRLETEHPEPTL